MDKLKIAFQIAEKIEVVQNSYWEAVERNNAMNLPSNDIARLNNQANMVLNHKKDELKAVLKDVLQFSISEVGDILDVQETLGNKALELRFAEYYLKRYGTSLAEISNGQF